MHHAKRAPHRMNEGMSLPSAPFDFLVGGDEMTALIRSKDWTNTSLGPIEQWPQSLRTTVSLCLASNFPINIIWGHGNAQIYNDGYRVVCGDAHPVALGQDYSVTWASAWPAIGVPFARARSGDTSFLENQRMYLTRNGYLEETFFTFSLSPIRDESGGIGGLFHPVTETTATMLAERRTRALRDLTASLANASDFAELAGLTIATLAPFEYDLPFLLFYGLGDDGAGYRLLAQHGIAAGTPATPIALPLAADAPWPIGEVVQAAGIVELGGASTRLRGIACGPYEEPPACAFAMPPVPWPLLEYDVVRQGFVVPLDHAILKAAPSYDAAELRELGGADHRSYGSAIYDYYGRYGVSPYW